MDDLNGGERSQNLGLFFNLTDDFGDNILKFSVDVRKVEIKVDEVTEIETLVGDEFLDSGNKLIKAFVRDVMFKFAALESSEPEKEIENF